jgi:hypothetical protein
MTKARPREGGGGSDTTARGVRQPLGLVEAKKLDPNYHISEDELSQN